MLSNGPSFSTDGDSQITNISEFGPDPRNTEPFFYGYLLGIQPGALI